MCSPEFYRQQAHRCLMLSRATPDPQVRLWLTDMASQYVKKAEAAQERTNGFLLLHSELAIQAAP